MIKKILIKLLYGLPSLLLLGMSYLGLLENLHYGFLNPGINDDGMGLSQFLSLSAIAVSSIVLFIKHEDRWDFVIPYFVTFFAVMRLVQITNVLSHYVEHYSS